MHRGAKITYILSSCVAESARFIVTNCGHPTANTLTGIEKGYTLHAVCFVERDGCRQARHAGANDYHINAVFIGGSLLISRIKLNKIII